jgi:hypothetical protein
LGEKGFPPPNGFTLIMASLRSAGQRVSEAYSRLKISASGRNGMAPVLLPCSRSAHDLVFLIVDVRDAFEEEQREHIGLEIGCIHRAAKYVGGFPKVGLELAQTHCRIIHKKIPPFRGGGAKC